MQDAPSLDPEGGSRLPSRQMPGPAPRKGNYLQDMEDWRMRKTGKPVLPRCEIFIFLGGPLELLIRDFTAILSGLRDTQNRKGKLV